LEVIEKIKTRTHLQGLKSPIVEKANIFGLIDEFEVPLDYAGKQENLYIRQLDGTMIVNDPVSDLQ
jgi:hypothetical protein